MGGGWILNSGHAASLLTLVVGAAVVQKNVELKSNDFRGFHFSPSAAAVVDIYGGEGNYFLHTCCVSAILSIHNTTYTNHYHAHCSGAHCYYNNSNNSFINVNTMRVTISLTKS